MIHSMTAFARESATTDQGILTVELRSVNHRYLDCTFKLPEALRQLEPGLREKARATLDRGKLDCLIRVQSHPGHGGDLQVNADQLERLLAATEVVRQRLADARPPSALEILQFPGIYGAAELSEEELQKAAQSLFDRTIAGLIENRLREGEKLAGLILDRLQQVEVADRITARVEELDLEIDRGRLEQELVYLAQKADVDEELDRLEAHVGEVRHALEQGGPCGRRLDFLMQELNREANTLSSKSIASSTTQNAVQLKVLIEQMREQIQNIE